jgi:acyl-CoA thioesterase-1
MTSVQRGSIPLSLLIAALVSPLLAQTGDDVPPARASDEHRPLVVFLGDSLTAGLGVNEDQAYPAVVAERLAAAGHPVRALNAGVSGDTSAGGVRRLNWLLSQHPDVVVVGLGSNDGLRGLPLEQTESNLRQIVTRVREAGSRVLLLGNVVPPNYGPDYAPKFAAIFSRIAKDLDVPLVPFLLEGVGGRPELNQGDGIHPTAEGHRIMAQTVFPKLEAIVAKLEATRR